MLKLVVATALAVAPLVLVTAPGATGSVGPTHTLQVVGSGVGMYPTYDGTVRRYAATTDETTFPSDAADNTTNHNASLTVNATTSDPAGMVLVDGVPVTDGQTTLSGLEAGQEISVIYVDSGGREADSVFVLPALFPTLATTINQPGVTSGDLALTLSQFFTPAPPAQPTPLFETVVDQLGVPVWVRSSHGGGMDLKLQPNGRFSVSRGGVSGQVVGSSSVVELDRAFQPVNAYHTVGGLTDTDNHDSILEKDGSRVLLSYEPNHVTGKTDAVIQEVDAAGKVTFQWDSSALVDETVMPSANSDYAHINSIQIVDNGEAFLASFRHLSAVIKIARLPHDGFEPGDIIWKLGGRDSSFTITDDAAPFPGPCGQHTASQLPNGNVMIFDDGSVSGFGNLCVDPADPTGPPQPRGQSRVAIYHLNHAQGTASLVWSYGPPGWFTFFMGSAQYLEATGNVMIGWAASTHALATEVAPDGTPVWQLKADVSPDDHTYFSYRAMKFDVPDAIDPVVTVSRPAADASYAYGESLTSDFSCTDTGGSTLQTCGDVLPGTTLDTLTPGVHTFTVTATDGAGNTTTETRRYTVGQLPPVGEPPPVGEAPAVFRPDVSIQRRDGTWLGAGIFGGTSTQTIRRTAAAGARVSLRFGLGNQGNQPDRCLVHGTGGTRTFRATYRHAGTEVTHRVLAGTWRTPLTPAGARQVLGLHLHVAAHATPGRVRAFTLTCSSTHEAARADQARVRITVR